MSKLDLEIIQLVCDADMILTNDWAKGFMYTTVEEMIARYENN